MGMPSSCQDGPMGTIFQGRYYASPVLTSFCRAICKMLRMPECAVQDCNHSNWEGEAG